MRYHIYRNFTVENLFKNLDASFSGYGDISHIPQDALSYVWFYLPSVNLSYRETTDEVIDFRARLELLLSSIPENKTFIALTAESLYSFSVINSSHDLTSAISEYNNFLFDLENRYNNIKVINFRDFINQVESEIFSWKFYYISQSLIHPRLNKSFNGWLNSKLNAINNIRKKCIVLDLDNTLWGGVLGEDGIEGIDIGNTYPGKAFYDFQKGLLELHASGVLLAVCSKNNESDVLEVWHKHPDILINKGFLSAYRINWKDKPSNIKEIAQELNIGLDSFVFIDDNPVERERVKFELPMVNVPEFPEFPYDLPVFLNKIKNEFFQTHAITKEDGVKTEQYKANFQRKEYSHKFTDLDDYLKSLKMELFFQECDNINIARISQMTQKTNQFNLTTIRYTEDDLRKLVDGCNLLSCLSIKDKFGDNGITVASIVLLDDKKATIDSFLLSCRILGRGIEVAYLLFLLNNLFEKGIKKVEAIYSPSEKNIQTENFYEDNGFSLVNIDKDGVKFYEMNLTKKLKIKNYYKFKI
jgi:FkbH-like protein